jgi:hypothetical protein
MRRAVKHVGKPTISMAIIRHFVVPTSGRECDEPRAKKKPPGEPDGLILSNDRDA